MTKNLDVLARVERNRLVTNRLSVKPNRHGVPGLRCLILARAEAIDSVACLSSRDERKYGHSGETELALVVPRLRSRHRLEDVSDEHRLKVEGFEDAHSLPSSSLVTLIDGVMRSPSPWACMSTCQVT